MMRRGMAEDRMTYLAVIVVQIVVLVALWVLGRYFGS
jgi:hypothetical protein